MIQLKGNQEKPWRYHLGCHKDHKTSNQCFIQKIWQVRLFEKLDKFFWKTWQKLWKTWQKLWKTWRKLWKTRRKLWKTWQFWFEKWVSADFLYLKKCLYKTLTTPFTQKMRGTHNRWRKTWGKFQNCLTFLTSSVLIRLFTSHVTNWVSCDCTERKH